MMRRRVHEWETMSDYGLRPHHQVDKHGDDHDALPALRNEELWAELLAAQKHLAFVEGRVRMAYVNEPMDEFEVACGRRLLALLDGPREPDGWREEWDGILAALAEHQRKA